MVSEIKHSTCSAGLLRTLAVFFLFLNLGWISLNAQDQSSFTQFYLNPYLLNSSYAGLDGQPSVSLLYRKQWMTIDGAPTTTNLSLHAPVNSRLGAGISITNDSKGFFNNSTVLFSGAYHVAVADHSFIRFGLSVGGSWNTVDMKKLETVNDPALGNALDKNTALAGNAGVSFHHRTFHFGVALPAIFSPAYVSEDAFNVKEVKPFQAVIMHASNRFYFNDNKNIFEPYLLYHVNTDLPSQFEFAGVVHLNHMVWAGASYKQYFGLSALGGIKLKNSLGIGASYSIQQSGPDELNSPSFEVSLNYLFGVHKRNAPVYSFVNAVKVKEKAQARPSQAAASARQKQVEAEQKRREEAARLKAEQEEKRRSAAADAEFKKKQALEADLKKKQAEADARAKSEKEAGDERKRVAEEKLRQQQTEKQTLAQNPPVHEKVEVKTSEPEKTEVKTPVQKKAEEKIPAPGKAEVISETVKEEPVVRAESQEGVQSGGQQPASVPQNIPERQPQRKTEQPQKIETNTGGGGLQPVAPAGIPTSATVRHEIVKQGNHPRELEASQYVILGTFKTSDNASQFSDGLRKLNYNTQFGHVTEKDLWYVYILKTTDVQKARAEQIRLSKYFLLKDAWLLTVQP